jgi:hypothetical protein
MFEDKPSPGKTVEKKHVRLNIEDTTDSFDSKRYPSIQFKMRKSQSPTQREDYMHFDSVDST